MTENTATVATLTAQVHVLQMGTRQITLGVAKQLDEVPTGEVEPFGRIRGIRSRGHSSLYVEVIGARVGTGELVRSYVHRADSELYAAWSALPLLVLAGAR